MRYFINFLWAFFLGGIFMFSGCEDNDFDFDNGWDGNVSDSSHVTVDTVLGIDVSMYEKARLFPGLVDTATERRIADTVLYCALNLKKFTEGGLYFYNPPQPIFSTGLYAGAGEVVTVEVPENVWGVTLQIGIHTENLTNYDLGLREPVAYYQKALYPGKNTVRSPLGGYMWLLRDADEVGTEVTPLVFHNVYAAPDFVLGQTDLVEWGDRVKSTTVPWLELRGKHVSFSVERSQLDLYFSNRPDFAREMENALKAWDELLVLYYKVQGLDENGTSGLGMPLFPERFVFDVQLEENLSRSTRNEQGLMLLRTARLYDNLLNIDSIADLRIMNAYSLISSKYGRFSSVTGWSDENFYVPLYRMAERNKAEGLASKLSDMGIGFNEVVPVALSYAASDTSKTFSQGLYVKKEEASLRKSLYLLPRVQMAKYEAYYQERAEWELFDEEARSFWGEGKDKTWFRVLCDGYGLDFTPFFDQWGMFVSDNEREYAMRYPLLDKQIWKINPLAENPYEGVGDFDASSFRYRTNRSGWSIKAWDNDGRTNEDTEHEKKSDWQVASNLLDGDSYTYWSSYLSKNSGGYQDSPSELPYYIVIDMGKEQEIDGFYYANGSVRCVSGFTLQTTDASGFDLEQHAGQEWKDLTRMGQEAETAKDNLHFVDLDRKATVRYLRLVFDKPNLFVPKEGEEENFEKFHLGRQQKFSEFGTYFYK